ncbi:MAG: helix-turn-helix transcriptional regulator [Christensenellaceae bacterium]
MGVSYKRLWKLLIDKNMSKADLRKAAGLAPNTMTKLRRDEPVAMGVLEKICGTLDTDFGDVMHFTNDQAQNNSREVYNGRAECQD